MSVPVTIPKLMSMERDESPSFNYKLRVLMKALCLQLEAQTDSVSNCVHE